ncbi:MAG: hypothetical protein ACYDBB_11945 [Armatimonadota bacterium]
MKMTRYNDCTIGNVISMRCRRSINNRDVIVLDNTKLEQVYVYEQSTIEGVMSYLQDSMNIDIVETQQSPITTKLVNHQSTGYIYQISHEEDDTRDDFHAFFLPLDED